MNGNNPLKSLFMLDPKVVFLNHGSFGAVPIPVIEQQINWQRVMENQPVEFLGRRIHDELARARQAVGKFLNTNRDNLVFVPNATHGINIVARSLIFPPGSEILTTDHEYGAMDRTWKFLAGQKGVIYKKHKVTLPITFPEAVVDDLFSDVTPNTKAIFISHISSPTSILFPVKEICQKAKTMGIMTIIDGAHAPGQIQLDLNELDPDFYTGNFHKWLCAPKGSAFLYTNPHLQHLIRPLVVSWGYEADEPGVSTFQDYLEWTGTRDFSPYLSVPAAIDFQLIHDWKEARESCHRKLTSFLAQWEKSSGIPSIYSSDQWYAQMATFQVPMKLSAKDLKSRLMDEYKIEIPVIEWDDRLFLRLSVQAYNTEDDLQCLFNALRELFL